MSDQSFGDVLILRNPICKESWWATSSPEGFTAEAERRTAPYALQLSPEFKPRRMPPASCVPEDDQAA